MPRPTLFPPRRNHSIIEHLESRRLLSTVTWTSPTSGNWETPSNWLNNTLPTSTDDVVIDQSSPITITITASESVASLTCSNNLTIASQQTLSLTGNSSATSSSISGNLILSGSFITAIPVNLSGPASTWTAGLLQGNFTNIGSLSLTTTAQKQIVGQLTNTGTITHTDGQLALGSNTASGDFLNDDDGSYIINGTTPVIDTIGSSNNSFLNEGIFEQTSATTTTLNIPNTSGSVGAGGVESIGGTFDVQAGTLNFITGTSLSNTTLTAVSGATLNFSSVNLNGTLTGTGSGNILFNDGMTSFTTSELGPTATATLNFPATLAQITAGPIVGPIINSASLILSTSAEKDLANTLTNNGTIDYTSGTFFIGNGPLAGSLINNGTFNIDGDQNISRGTSSSTIINTGTLDKTSGSGATTIASGINNTGAVEVDSGTLSLAYDSTQANIPQIIGTALTGGVWFANGGTLTIPTAPAITTDAATITLNGPNSSFTNLSALNQIDSGSTLSLLNTTFQTPGDLTNNGSLNLSGTLNILGNFTQTSTGSLNFLVDGTPSTPALSSTAATLSGTLTSAPTNGFSPPTTATYTVATFVTPETGSFTKISTDPSLSAAINPRTITLNGSSVLISTLRPTLAGRLPTSPLVAGQKNPPINQTIKLTNTGRAPIKGNITLTILLSTDPTGDSGGISLGINLTRKINLKPNAKTTIPITIRSIPLIATGTFYILAQVTDPAGAIATGASTNTITSNAPFLDLTGSIPHLPPKATAGKKISIPISVTELGNIPVKGILTTELFASANGLLDNNSINLGPISKHISILPSKHATLTLTITLPELPQALYTIFAKLDPDNLLNDTNRENNIFASTNTISIT